MTDDTIIDNGMGQTLQAELEQMLDDFVNSLPIKATEIGWEAIGENKQETLKAILATVSKHLPEKNGDIKGVILNQAGEAYYDGFNAAITEMNKILGGNV